FFTGVSEGVISFDRIITMLNVEQGELVVEAKGIYSVEKFLIARRLMYWQVYLHKTVVGAEQMLLKILYRAKELSAQGHNLFATRALRHFLTNKISHHNFLEDERHLDWFTLLYAKDVLSTFLEWICDDYYILATLFLILLCSVLLRIKLRNSSFSENETASLHYKVKRFFNLP